MLLPNMFESMEQWGNRPPINNKIKEKEYYVFVYGSLLKGFGNNRLLKDSKCLGKAVTNRKYKMVSLGGFPAVLKVYVEDIKNIVLPSKKAQSLSEFSKVSGEVYCINEDTLKNLDRLEGNGSFYNREEIEVTLENGEEKTVWIYFIKNRDSYSKHNLCKRDINNYYCWNTTKEKERVNKNATQKKS